MEKNFKNRIFNDNNRDNMKTNDLDTNYKTKNYNSNRNSNSNEVLNNDVYYKKSNYKSPNNRKFIDFKKKQNIYCVNCGEKGHIVKECFEPITSYGIISFKVNKNEEDDKYDKNDKLNKILKS